jgi:hypothetical protein
MNAKDPIMPNYIYCIQVKLHRSASSFTRV